MRYQPSLEDSAAEHLSTRSLKARSTSRKREYYAVESILACRQRGESEEYCVKWAGYKGDTTWEASHSRAHPLKALRGRV